MQSTEYVNQMFTVMYPLVIWLWISVLYVIKVYSNMHVKLHATFVVQLIIWNVCQFAQMSWMLLSVTGLNGSAKHACLNSYPSITSKKIMTFMLLYMNYQNQQQTVSDTYQIKYSNHLNLIIMIMKNWMIMILISTSIMQWVKTEAVAITLNLRLMTWLKNQKGEEHFLFVKQY